ncbi:hypothetical protein [Microcoleus phage My-WqHQDG]|nr:hypothetical protein [Microcoleus phage My-WqHQDG]
MECVYVNRSPQWVIYHIQKQGGRGKYIESIKEAEPLTPWEDPITYVMTKVPKELPPWGTLWVSGDKDTLGSYPDYGAEILKKYLHILDKDLCVWLLSKYSEYPQALERLILQLRVLTQVKGRVLLIEDVQSLVITTSTTSFLWRYQKVIGKPVGLKLIYSASNSDLWTAYMVDGGLMKHLKAMHPPLVHSLYQMRGEIDRGASVVDSAILWHLNTMYHQGLMAKAR